MEAYPSPISALRARVMMAATPQELSALWQELEQLKFSYKAFPDSATAGCQTPWNYTTVPPSCTPWGYSSRPGSHYIEASRVPSWGSDATSSTAVSTPRRAAPVFTEAFEADGYATPVRWAGDGVCSDVSRSPPSTVQESPTTFVIRKTFIEFLDPKDDATQGQTGPMARVSKSCPGTPKGSCDTEDSIHTVTAAAEQLALVSPVTLQASPAVQEVANMGSYIPDGNNMGHAELRILRLADSLEELPSQGSALHSAGRCKPCAFVHTKGCNTGKACPFCHLCDQGSSKRRKKALRDYLRTNCPVSGADGHSQAEVDVLKSKRESQVMHATATAVRIVPR